MPRVLIVDDEQIIRRALSVVLAGMSCEVVLAEDGVDALGKLGSGTFDLVITDLRMPRADGFAVLRAAREQQPRAPVIMLTGHGSIPDCVTALRGGAYNFLTKPFHVTELTQVVREALGAGGTAAAPVRRESGRATLLGESQGLRAILDLVQRVADSDATVLITGESGSGKEVVAR